MITLFANLNARSSQPSPDSVRVIERVAIRGPNAGGAISPLPRSAAHTIHRDLTSVPNQDHSRVEEGARHVEEAENQDAGHAEESGSIRELEEVEAAPAEQG